jgi:hypothetical protein
VDDDTLPPGALKPVVQYSAGYTIVWLVLGLAQYGYEVGSGTDNDYTVFVLFPFSTIAWIDKIATAPALGAFLLVFGIEAAHATTAIKKLQEAARTKTLTRHLYVAARKRIRERMVGWRLGVGILACVALYNTIGLFVILERPGLDPTFKHRNEEQVQHAVVLGKEVVLLLMILALIVPVNDHADAVVTLLNSEPWGTMGSKEENTRMDLLFLTTTTSITAEAADSFRKRFVTSKSRPISFRILSLRPTGDMIIALVYSTGLYVVGTAVRFWAEQTEPK